MDLKSYFLLHFQNKILKKNDSRASPIRSEMKLLILLITVLALSFAQFQPGIMTLGGGISYSQNRSEGGDNEYEYKSTELNISPTIGYFITSRLQLNIAVSKTKYTSSLTYREGTDKYEDSSISKSCGLGARYYFGWMYGGGSLSSYGEEYFDFDYKSTELGYLYPVKDSNVYLDIYARYRIGTKDNNALLKTIGVQFLTFF